LPPLYDVTEFDSTFEKLVSLISSLRTLELHDVALLEAPLFAALTALQSLRAVTWTLPEHVAPVVPALSQLTRLEYVADCDSDMTGSAYRFVERRGQVSGLLQTLSALQSLRDLQLGGTAYNHIQLLEGKLACPALEVLILDVSIEGTQSFLAFFDQPGRLATVSVSRMVVDGREQEHMRFRAAMAQRASAFVSFIVQRWCRFLDCVSPASSASGIASDTDSR